MEPNQTPSPVETVTAPQFKLSIPAAIIVAGFIIAVAILAVGFVGKGGDSEQAKAPIAVNIKDVNLAGEPFVGNPNATPIAYFSDFQCPFCKKFETGNIVSLKKDYVDTGKIKIVFKDFVFLGPDSVDAAVYARAVWSLYPNEYYAWRQAMFTAQDQEGNVGFGNRKSIEALTKTIPGIDQAKVSANLDANKDAYSKAVDADYVEGQKLGVQGTPSVIIGKTIIDGAYPLSSYTDALKNAVK